MQTLPDPLWTARATIRFLTAGLILTFLAGCSHNSIEDDLRNGDQAMQATHLADAEVAYEAATKAAPQDPRPYLALGNLYSFEQKPTQAEPEFMHALELDPKNAAAHAGLGDAYASGQPAMAEAQYRAAVALDPAAVAWRLKLGAALQAAHKDHVAEPEFLTAIGLEPKNAHAHLALANLLNGEPDRQADAQAEFAQVRALDPSLMPAAPVTASAAPASTVSLPASAAASSKLRALDKKFLLTHDSPVYQEANNSAPVVAQVHRRRVVHVTGMAGDWFRIQMRNGTVGYVPVTAAE
jgi:tetratricopeptide (TPR) repeat protein